MAIDAQTLERRFGESQAVRGIDVSIARGELFGLVGPDGAGKTTTMRMMAGLLSPSSGRVRVLGEDPRRPALRERIGMVPQEHTLYGDLSIDENLSFFGKLFGLKRDEFRARRRELLEITRLAPFADRRARALSGGMYKKLALACALLHRPEVVLLDEPTNGVDPVSRRQLWELLYRFVDEGTTVVLSTPYMDEASRCHRVALLDRGKLLAEGTPGALIAQVDDLGFLVVGGERAAVHAALAEAPEVLARSPAGAQLRIVVRHDGVDAIRGRVAAVGAELRPVELSFEDVFLTMLHHEEASA